MTDTNIQSLKNALQKQIDINKRLDEDVAALSQDIIALDQIIKTLIEASGTSISKIFDKTTVVKLTKTYDEIKMKNKLMINRDLDGVALDISKQEELLRNIN